MKFTIIFTALATVATVSAANIDTNAYRMARGLPPKAPVKRASPVLGMYSRRVIISNQFIDEACRCKARISLWVTWRVQACFGILRCHFRLLFRSLRPWRKYSIISIHTCAEKLFENTALRLTGGTGSSRSFPCFIMDMYEVSFIVPNVPALALTEVQTFCDCPSERCLLSYIYYFPPFVWYLRSLLLWLSLYSDDACVLFYSGTLIDSERVNTNIRSLIKAWIKASVNPLHMTNRTGLPIKHMFKHVPPRKCRTYLLVVGKLPQEQMSQWIFPIARLGRRGSRLVVAPAVAGNTLSYQV